MRTSHVPVLVVGAGSAGSLLALELARWGVHVRTVDRAPRPTSASHAFILHARALELLERIDERLVARFLERGVRCRGYAVHAAGAAVRAAVDFSALDSRYPFLLVHRQSETERYLREYASAHFGESPDWGTSCVELREADDGVVATLESDGAREQVHCRFLVGCDGAASRVRAAAGFDADAAAAGAGAEGGVVLENLDVVLEGFPDDDWVHYCSGAEGLLVIARLPGGFHRLQRAARAGPAADDAAAARAFQRSLDAHFRGVRLGQVVSRARWQRGAERAPVYCRGRVFLAGDAAHGHSTVSSLDLDCALQDALNLGWKLACVLKELAPPALLASYETERRPIAAEVAATAAALQAALAAHEPTSPAESLAVRCSGLALDYRGTAAVPAGLAPLGGPATGAFAPDVELARGRRLASLLRRPAFTLLGSAAAEAGVRALESLLAPLGRRFPAALAVHVIGPSEGFAQRYGASDADRLWLLRPDGYLELKCLATELAALEARLAERLVG